jgi:hypothetical protein
MAEMAETVSLASGLLTLATFAFQSTVTLYGTVKSFCSQPRHVRDLTEELEALNGVLRLLLENVNANTDTDLSTLKLPLLRCGSACKDFETELIKCSSGSSDSRTSFREWARLKYMGYDIDGFTRLVARYKLTINVALTDANLRYHLCPAGLQHHPSLPYGTDIISRKSTVTAEALVLYQGLVETAKAELEVHLEAIDGNLEALLGKYVPMSDVDSSELRVIQEERQSAENCLQICSQLSDHISQVEVAPDGTPGFSGFSNPDNFPERLTSESLQERKRNLSLTRAKLEKHMRDLADRLLTISKSELSSEEHLDRVRLRH